MHHTAYYLGYRIRTSRAAWTRVLEPKVRPCGRVEQNKPFLPCSCMEISTCSVYSPTSFVHVKGPLMISMHKPSSWGLFSSTLQKNDRSRKEEATGTCTYPPRIVLAKCLTAIPPLSFSGGPGQSGWGTIFQRRYLLIETFSQVRHNFLCRSCYIP